MHKIKLLLIFISLIKINMLAQCDDANSIKEDGICDYSEWDWESNDCSMWLAKTGNNDNLDLLPNPFFSGNQSSRIIEIAKSKDYTRENGWELIRRDFGCSGINAFPFFILYNKYSGVFRVYMYLNSNNAQWTNGYTMEFGWGFGKFSPLMALQTDKANATDSYFNNKLNDLRDDEVAYYIGSLNETVQNSWVAGEFQPALFTDINDSSYKGASIQINIFANETQNINASIDGEAFTKDMVLYGQKSDINEKTDGITKINTVLAKGKKLVDKAPKVLSLVNKLMTKKIKNGIDLNKSTSYISRTWDIFNATTEGSGLSKFLGQLSSGLKEAPGILSTVGDFLGLISSGDKPTPATATFTTYDLELSGTIEIKTAIQSISVDIPGTEHDYSANNLEKLPYYDCPLGIANLKTTPKVDVVSYQRYSTDSKHKDPVSYKSYRGANDLDFKINSVSGYEEDFVKIAFIAKIEKSKLNPPTKTIIVGVGKHKRVIKELNQFQADIEHGILEVLSTVEEGEEDDKKTFLLVSSRFVDIRHFKSLTFNIPEPAEVSLKIVARLKKHDSGNNDVYIFDKAFNFISVPS